MPSPFQWTEVRDPVSGEMRRVTLPVAYAMAALPVFHFRDQPVLVAKPDTPLWQQVWLPRTMPPKKDQLLYSPRIEARAGVFTIQTTRSHLTVYVLEASVIVALIGWPFYDVDLDELFTAWRPLPRSTEVARAIIERADWLDENPMYRGITHKESATEKRKQGASDYRRGDDG